MKKLTPLITVEEIEPCLPFWTDRLGFEVTVTVPQDEKMGFAILQKGAVEIMYQSRASLVADLPALADELVGQTTALFIEVDGIDELLEGLEGAEVLVPRRQTSYGMDEIFVRAPCGTVVGLAAPVAEE